jgi:hypothetical protein
MAADDVALGSFSSLGFASRSGSAWPIGRGVGGADVFEIILRISPPHKAAGKAVRLPPCWVAIPILAAPEFYHEPQVFAEANFWLPMTTSYAAHWEAVP